MDSRSQNDLLLVLGGIVGLCGFLMIAFTGNDGWLFVGFAGIGLVWIAFWKEMK